MKTIEDPGHRQERARRGSFKLQEGRMKIGASRRTVDDSTPLPLGQSLSLATSSLYVFRTMPEHWAEKNQGKQNNNNNKCPHRAVTAQDTAIQALTWNIYLHITVSKISGNDRKGRHVEDFAYTNGPWCATSYLTQRSNNPTFPLLCESTSLLQSWCRERVSFNSEICVKCSSPIKKFEMTRCRTTNDSANE